MHLTVRNNILRAHIQASKTWKNLQRSYLEIKKQETAFESRLSS